MLDGPLTHLYRCDEKIDEYVVLGTADDCLQGLMAYAEVECTHVISSSSLTRKDPKISLTDQMRRLTAELLPMVQCNLLLQSLGQAILKAIVTRVAASRCPSSGNAHIQRTKTCDVRNQKRNFVMEQ